MAATRDLQYCKTDLIASKGIVFCKYSKASSALIALEEITETGTVSTAGPYPMQSQFCRSIARML